jgi:hypothetical protein
MFVAEDSKRGDIVGVCSFAIIDDGVNVIGVAREDVAKTVTPSVERKSRRLSECELHSVGRFEYCERVRELLNIKGLVFASRHILNEIKVNMIKPTKIIGCW